jgi:hypothetical protein
LGPLILCNLEDSLDIVLPLFGFFFPLLLSWKNHAAAQWSWVPFLLVSDHYPRFSIFLHFHSQLANLDLGQIVCIVKSLLSKLVYVLGQDSSESRFLAAIS